jgi:hypothetical protein
MKNGSASEKLQMQEQELRGKAEEHTNIPVKEEKENTQQELLPSSKMYSEAESLVSTVGSLFSFEPHNDYDEDRAEYLRLHKKKKKKKGISR